MRRFFCKDCKKKFVYGKEIKKREWVKRHLEDKSSYRDIARRGGPSKNTALKAVHEIGDKVKSSYWIAKNLHPKWSGVLCIDGTYINVKNFFAEMMKRKGWLEDERFLHKMIIILGTDYHTRDLPHYTLGDNENMIDLILYFQELKRNGYDLSVLVSDGNERIEEAARKVYERPIVTQRCQRHFLAKMDEVIVSKENKFQQEKMLKLKDSICRIICASDIDSALLQMNEFMVFQNQWKISPVMNYLVTRFIRDFAALTMYLQYPKGFIPRTANVSENMNKQLKDRLTSMKGFESIKFAEDYLKLWCLKRRFQKFTDCKKPHAHFNGKSPLELAGCNITNLDYLNL